MKERSCGAVIFRREEGEIKVLLLFRKAHDHFKALWDCPRGQVEAGEEEQETAAREIQEETGLTDVNFLPNFREKISWFYTKEKKRVFKEAIYYCVETTEEEIRISEEHQDYKWVTIPEALKLVQFKNTKSVLEKAATYLKVTPK